MGHRFCFKRVLLYYFETQRARPNGKSQHKYIESVNMLFKRTKENYCRQKKNLVVEASKEEVEHTRDAAHQRVAFEESLARGLILKTKACCLFLFKLRPNCFVCKFGPSSTCLCLY